MDQNFFIQPWLNQKEFIDTYHTLFTSYVNTENMPIDDFINNLNYRHFLKVKFLHHIPLSILIYIIYEKRYYFNKIIVIIFKICYTFL